MSFGSEVKGVIDRKLDEAGLSQHDYVRAALKWQYNWGNVTAAVVLNLLGLGGDSPELAGEVSTVQARRAIIRARATFDRRAPELERPATDTQRPGEARFIFAGVSTNTLRERLATFERLLGYFASQGCTRVGWS
jgi:hypothetical protein